MTPRAITGFGIASTIGVGAGTFVAAMRADPGLATTRRSRVTSFNAGSNVDPPILEVPDFDPTKQLGDKGLRTLDRLTKLLLVSARLGLDDAGLKREGQWQAGASPLNVGLCCSNAYGSLEAITELDRVAKLEAARYINPAKFPNTVSNTASGYVSIWEDLRALNVTVSDGNCGGLDAMGCADVFLATGRAEVIMTGGGEAMSEALYLAFGKLGALEASARLGEGSAFFALESTERATARGARIRAEFAGYGTAFVAPKDEASLLFASAEALARAIEQALAEAGTDAADVDLVASSLCGIPQFDDCEREALARIVPRAPIAAPKFVLGETLGAGGAMAIAAGVAWFEGAAVAPLVSGDPPPKLDIILVTALGYYGNASAIVLRKPRA